MAIRFRNSQVCRALVACGVLFALVAGCAEGDDSGDNTGGGGKSAGAGGKGTAASGGRSGAGAAGSSSASGGSGGGGGSAGDVGGTSGEAGASAQSGSAGAEAGGAGEAGVSGNGGSAGASAGGSAGDTAQGGVAGSSVGGNAGDSAQGGSAGQGGSGGAAGAIAWLNQDIGEVGAVGSTTQLNGTFTIQASGVDIWDQTDEFHFVHVQVANNVEITARVVSLQKSADPWAKSGVMIRESLAANSKHAFMAITVNHGLAFQNRMDTGGASSHTAGLHTSAPRWVRLRRAGTTFTGFESVDNNVWTEVGSAAISMNSTVYVGLAVTSHADGTLCTSVIESVSVTSE